MLDPQTRLALTEALTPPPGFTLDHAVGTTFTLDLETALSVPLALAARRVTDAHDPLSILDALHRTEEHVDLFAQAGQISMGAPSTLVTLLERSIHQVVQPSGLFHPKVWFLRFTDGHEDRFRFVCTSRNLTQDRSWDVVVQLEGAAGSDASLRALNAPLANLLRRLPNTCLHPFDPDRRARIDRLADQWESIRWELPDDVGELRFHVLGPETTGRPPMGGRRALVVSPFLSDGGIAFLCGNVKKELHVFSRPESLERLQPPTLQEPMHTYVLDDMVDVPVEEDDELQASQNHRALLHGLHAKVVIHDQPDGSTRVLLGSANATDAAWHQNTEVMVEMRGRAHRIGVKPTLESIKQLAEEYVATGGEEPSTDEEAEYEVELLLRSLAAVPVTMRLTGNGPCDVDVWSEDATDVPGGVQLEWQMLHSPRAIPGGIPGRQAPHRLEAQALEEITPFLIITARAGLVRKRTIVIAHIEEDVARRRTAALTTHISDQAAFLRLLTMMLDLTGLGGGFLPGPAGGSGPTAGADFTRADGLLEALVTALGHGSSSLQDVQRIIDFISNDPQQRQQLLPPGFTELWTNVQEAFERTRSRT